MIDKELLDILVCPETKQDLKIADAALVEKINSAVSAGALTNRAGGKVSEKINSALVRSDGKYCYPVREDIPIMLIDEGIPLDQPALA